MPRSLDRTPTASEAVLEAVDARLRELHVAMPGVVVEWDSTHRTATVQPQIQRAIPDDRGNWQLESLPVIYDVPIVSPACGGFEILLPVRPGDTVLLLFPDRDITTWRQTGDVSDPGDQRAHTIAGAVAILGLFPNAGQDPAGGGQLTIGAKGGLTTTFTTAQVQVGGTTSAVTRDDHLQFQLSALKNAIASGVPVANDGGANLQATIMSALAAWPGSTSSSKLTVGG